MQVRSLNQEDPLEKEMATLSSVLPGEFHGQRSLERESPWGHKESDTTERLTLSLFDVFSALHSKLTFCVVFVQHLNPTHPLLQRLPPSCSDWVQLWLGFWTPAGLWFGWRAVGRLVTSCWLRYEPWHLGYSGANCHWHEDEVKSICL